MKKRWFEKTFFRRLNENSNKNVIGKRKARKKYLNWYSSDDFFNY